MKKPIRIGAHIFLILLAIGVISLGVGGEMAARPALALDDGPALTSSSQKQTTEADQSGQLMPDMNPSQDSPDAPVKTNVEAPAETNSDVQPAEEEHTTPSEIEPTKAADNTPSPAEKPVAEPSKTKRELTPALTALRDKVRRTLATYQKISFNTRQNTADEIIDYCLALGCDAEISMIEAGKEKRANAITCLCWNYRFAGFEPLSMVNDHISARIGYGTQSRPSELLAVLALARVQSTYPMRVGDTARTVADLVESEKLSCRSGTDMSLKLIGLSYYVDTPTWRNDLDEEWSLEKIIREGLAQQALAPGGAGLERLMGLSYAVNRREKRNLPIAGQYARAKKYIDDFHNYAINMQNSDGSWGYYLSNKGANRDALAGLRSTGSVLQWLALSLPEDRLDDQAMTAGMSYLLGSLGQKNRTNLPALSSQEIAGAMRALHALAIYDDRLFKPADPEQSPGENKPDNATAKKQSAAGSSR